MKHRWEWVRGHERGRKRQLRVEMKIMNHIIVCVLIMAVTVSCTVSNRDDVRGTYVKINQVNTIDTIRLYENAYIQHIYTNDGKLVVNNKGSYEILESGMVVFKNFYFNYDRNFKKFPEILTTSYGELAVFIRKGLGGVGFCSGHFEGENCYYRIP